MVKEVEIPRSGVHEQCNDHSLAMQQCSNRGLLPSTTHYSVTWWRVSCPF